MIELKDLKDKGRKALTAGSEDKLAEQDLNCVICLNEMVINE